MKTSIPLLTSFYDYQQRDISAIFDVMQNEADKKIVYQLPTGGGKTVMFSEIARRFINKYGQTVTILTHRRELSAQISNTLKKVQVKNKVINSKSTNFRSDCQCYVAMVETLRNRIKTGKIKTAGVGLVIIDEAHHNSFRKLLKYFKDSYIVGVTATPFSSDISKPMRNYYDRLITGESIGSLIKKGFLAKPKSYVYEVELNSLKTGSHGDYTVSSSNEFYGSSAMQDLLLKAYMAQGKRKKTLIFNNGIAVSKMVLDNFSKQGIDIKHLDNETPDDERTEILKWFKKTKGAVLTSVSILTTGFDEPTVQHIMLNRATTSITLYHQMIGRGARKLANKKTFAITDLGNNIQRFGDWDAEVDWNFSFENPEEFAKQLNYQSCSGSAVQSHALSAELRAQFPNTLEMTFDIEGNYTEAIEKEKKTKTVIQQSIRQQAMMCLDNAESLTHALSLAESLTPESDWRVKQYVKCLGNASKNYKDWLMEDYQSRLKTMITKLYAKFNSIHKAGVI